MDIQYLHGPAFHDARVVVPATKISTWGAHLKLWLLLLEGSVDVPARKVGKTAQQLGLAASIKVSQLSVATSTAADILSALKGALGIVDGTVTTEAGESSEAAEAAEAAVADVRARHLDQDIISRARGTSNQHKDGVVLRCHDATVSSTAPAEDRVLTTLKALLSMVRKALSTASTPARFAEIVSEALTTCTDIASFVGPLGYTPAPSAMTRLCSQHCPAALLGRVIGTREPHIVTNGHGCGHGAAAGMCKQCAPKQGPWLATLKVSEAAPTSFVKLHHLGGGGGGGGGFAGAHWGALGHLGHLGHGGARLFPAETHS